MIVNVHRNLALPGGKGFSVKDRNLNLVQHCHYFTMSTAECVVQPAGWARVQSTGNRNVHAFLRGTLDEVVYGRVPPYADSNGMEELTYNPHGEQHFYFRSDPSTPIEHVVDVVGILGKVYARV